MISKRTSPLFLSISIIVLSVLLIQSCTKVPTPAFSYQPSTNPEAGDSIMFTNASLDATSYSWDFGDTYTSTDEHTSNVYVEAGAYTVTLTASNEKKSDMISELITINEPTVLGVFAVEDDDNDDIAVTNCSVWVYDNLDDWNNYNDPQFEAMTDVDGFALFLNLEAQVYIVDLYKQTDTGVWSAAWELEALTLNEANLFLLPMTFEPNSKKSSKRSIDSRASLKTASKAIK